MVTLRALGSADVQAIGRVQRPRSVELGSGLRACKGIVFLIPSGTSPCVVLYSGAACEVMVKLVLSEREANAYTWLESPFACLAFEVTSR